MAQSGSPASDPRSQSHNTKHNTVIAPALYYFSASALAISLNINTGQSTFTASETCSVSVASGAAIKVKNSLPLAEQPNKYLTLGYNAQLGYRQFTFIGYNTVFGHPGNKYIASNIYVYIRLDASNNGSTGELIFLPYELDYDGRLMLEEGASPIIYPDVTIVQRQETIGEETHTYWTLPNDNEDNDSKLKYYYIHIGTISEPVNGARSWLNAIQTGQLETAKGNDEKADTLLEKMFRLSPSNIIQVLLPFDKLSFAASGDLFINRITNQHGADPDLTNDDFGTFTEWIYENTIATTRSIAAYVKSKIRALDQRYFRKDIPDTSPHEATFGDLHVAKNLPLSESEQAAVSNGNLVVDNNATIGGNENVQGDAAVQGTTHVKKKAIFGGNADEQSVEGHDLVAYSIYGAGYGWRIDRAGNMEVESLHVRSVLEAEELLINRLQAQEGDTIFTDNDQIEDMQEVYDEVLQEMTYILTFKEKWDGYFTAQRYGNILKGIINTLAANYVSNQQGRGDVITPSSDPNSDWQKQENDAGGNKYFTSWMWVIADRNTDHSLGLNQVRVVLFPDNEIAQAKNYPPCINMVVGRWGCKNYATDDPAELASIKERQSFFYISSSEGRIMKLHSVSQPILDEGNYGMVFGNIPDFIRNWNSWERLVREHPHLQDRDYLFAQGVIYSDLVHVDIKGAPVPVTVDCGDWIDGSTATGSVTDDFGDTVQLPAPRRGIYYNTQWHDKANQFESHVVRHRNGRWLCLTSQPSMDDGALVYHEPKFGSIHWRLIDGNENYTIEFVSSNGHSFRRGYVDTIITPHLFIGNVDITDDISVSHWSWTRTSEHPTQESAGRDANWDATHSGIVTQSKSLHLTNSDMDLVWASNNKQIFTCSVSIDDGKSTVIVQNQVIS